MRIALFSIVVCAVLLCISSAAPPAPTPQDANVVKVTPLILEKNEGERRLVRG